MGGSMIRPSLKRITSGAISRSRHSTRRAAVDEQPHTGGYLAAVGGLGLEHQDGGLSPVGPAAAGVVVRTN
jgi:hypothetical protein